MTNYSLGRQMRRSVTIASLCPERPREELAVMSLLPLPFDPILLLGAGVGLAFLGVLGLKLILTQDRATVVTNRGRGTRCN